METTTADSPQDKPLSLFEGYGIELEYMIVDAATLDVRPIADRLLHAAAGEPTREWERGRTAWCNELAMHVIEFKFSRPWPSLAGAAGCFQQDVARANELLAAEGCRLLPSAMHPWMDPIGELTLWPHENEEIYRRYDEIFDCQGHGWANLQSTHINLPFADDDEFGRLHAAIRLVLPLLPALAASSPVMDGSLSGRMDNRLFTYRNNSRRIPSVTGQVIPEPVFSIADYHERILEPMYGDIAPLDPGCVLQEDWLNSRGAIARFERQSIEIRLLDIQECPAADLGVAALVCALVRELVEERVVSYRRQQGLATEALAATLMACAKDAEETMIEDAELLACLGMDGPARAREIWLRCFERLQSSGWLVDECEPFARHYREHGTLARRLVRAIEAGGSAGHSVLHQVYGRLAEALATGRPFAA